MEKVRFQITDEHQLIGIMYVKNMESAEKMGEEIGYNYEIHEESEDEVGFKYSIQWKSEEAVEIAHKMKKEGILPEYYDWICPTCNFNYQKISKNAIEPRKGHHLDSGYDLHATGIHKVDEANNTYYLSTGLKIRPPYGYYFEMYPRSSLSKSGFMLANSVGVIDQNYRGEIIIALKKVVQDSELPEFPWKCVQIIPKQFIHLTPVETDELDETIRGEGGFGSTSV